MRGWLLVAGIELALAAWTAAVLVCRYRATGAWSAAEVLPRPVARAILVEVRLWVALARWVRRRHDGRGADAFGYHRGLSHVIGAVVALVAVEGAVTELVLIVTLGDTAWPWVALGLHLYGLAWLVGLHAAHVTRPHLITDDALLVRDGVFAEIAVPLRDVLGARPVRVAGVGRSGYRVTGGVARLSHGDATVALDLDGVPNRLLISVDDPGRFVERVRAATVAARTPRSAPSR